MLLRLFKKFLLPGLIRKLEEGYMRDVIVDKVNKRIDLKSMDEKQERALINKLYLAVVDVVVLTLRAL